MNSKKERNSVLELLRLCASLWVMYYHGLSLITRGQYFSNGRIAVDFFFILSGFFFLKSFNKESQTSVFKGMFKFLGKRMKALMPTVAICLVFSTYYHIAFALTEDSTSLFGYMWYIQRLLDTFAIYYLLGSFIKSKKAFNITVSVIVVVNYFLILYPITDGGICRGLAGIGAGILLSQVPTLKEGKFKQIFSISITSILFTLLTYIAYIAPYTLIEDSVCLLVIFPALIYFANQIKFSNKYINYVCSISFGLYAYQSFTRIFEEYGLLHDGWEMFVIILAIAILDRVAYYLVKHFKHKKSTV